MPKYLFIPLPCLLIFGWFVISGKTLKTLHLSVRLALKAKILQLHLFSLMLSLAPYTFFLSVSTA